MILSPDFRGTITIIQTAWMGDVLMSLPLVACLRSAFSLAHLRYVAVPAAVPMLQGTHLLDSVVAFDKKGKHRSFRQLFGKGAGLRLPQDHVVLCLHSSLRSAILTWAAQPDFAVGPKQSVLQWVYAETYTAYPAEHDVYRQAGAAKSIGVSLNCIESLLPICIWKEEDMIAANIKAGFDTSSGYIVLAPGAAWATKRWPLEKYMKLAGKLAPYLPVVIIGDTAVQEEVQKHYGSQTGIFNLAGMLSVTESAACIYNAALTVCNDSMPLHLTWLQDKPVIAIFGPTSTTFGFAPLNNDSLVIQDTTLACRPCSPHGTKECPIATHQCMKNITVERVMSAVKAMIPNLHIETV